ncbi:hypothetical protein BEI_2844 [Halomonas beimenensis]|uniref:Uncharacterized protein n=1 Tax=Halomonas beimenensis TaxID=475662 RepID=A0A291PAD9_9GAMM|nr:hypothetical protein BEI_2844 [Halomonas beimenensis]
MPPWVGPGRSLVSSALDSVMPPGEGPVPCGLAQQGDHTSPFPSATAVSWYRSGLIRRQASEEAL